MNSNKYLFAAVGWELLSTSTTVTRRDGRDHRDSRDRRDRHRVYRDAAAATATVTAVTAVTAVSRCPSRACYMRYVVAPARARRHSGGAGAGVCRQRCLRSRMCCWPAGSARAGGAIYGSVCAAGPAPSAARARALPSAAAGAVYGPAGLAAKPRLRPRRCRTEWRIPGSGEKPIGGYCASQEVLMGQEDKETEQLMLRERLGIYL